MGAAVSAEPGGSSSTSSAQSSFRTFVCSPNEDDFFPPCKEVLVKEGTGEHHHRGKPARVSTSRASGQIGTDGQKQDTPGLVAMQERLQTKLSDYHMEEPLKSFPLQVQQQPPKTASIHGDIPPLNPIDATNVEPVRVSDSTAVHQDLKKGSEIEGPGRPLESTAELPSEPTFDGPACKELGVDIAALIDNNKDDSFIALILQGEDPALAGITLPQEAELTQQFPTDDLTRAYPAGQEKKPGETPLLAKSVTRSGIEARGGKMLPEAPLGPIGTSPFPSTTFMGPNLQTRTVTGTPFNRGFVPMSSLMAKSSSGSGARARSHTPVPQQLSGELPLADLATLGTTPPTGCERQLIEIALRKMFSKLETVALDHVVDTFREWRLPASVAIVQQGSPITTGPGLSILLDGVVDVLHRPKGSTVTAAELEKVCTYDRTGQCFGELELIYNAPRGSGATRRTHWATTATRTPVTLWSITRDALQQEVIGHCYLGTNVNAWTPASGLGNMLTMV
mmetsp:Transcript_6342/g.13850  ORF Transcript_6342/g.13850 Transcript_6342/m.13850 type:complete len:508 (-) Transcript_6342:260-1783(-)